MFKMRYDETGFALGRDAREAFETEVADAMENLKASFGQDAYHREFYMRRVAFLNQWALDNQIYGKSREVVESTEMPRLLGLV